MNSITKKITLAGLGAVCAVSLSMGAGLLAKSGVVADADTVNAPSTTTFFHDYLLDENGNEYTLAKKFYNAFEKINENGDFKKGVVDYPIDDIVTSNQLKGWVEDGNLEVPRAFSAARDTFLTDHPEIFYVDFYKLTLSVAKSGSSYVGFIDSGKNANVFRDNGFNTVTAVANAIEKFESKVNEVVTAVNNAQAKDTYSDRDVFLAREVNKYLGDSIEYDYGSYENKDNPDAVTGAYINTPYGGLVDGVAVCGGYSTAYKVIMDRLGVPCITVNGYSNNKDQNGFNSGSSVYHMWNYVWLANPNVQTKSRAARAATNAGEWYSVDVTWDSTAPNAYRYAVLNEYSDAQYHVNDGVISSSGYRLRYPALSPYSYGATGETEGLQSSIDYIPTDETDDYNNTLVSTYIAMSYNGKSAKRLLEEDGLYLAFRNAAYDKTTKELKWTDWASAEIFRQWAVDYEGINYSENFIQDTGAETRFYENTSVYYTQIAVFDFRPDRASPNSNPNPTLGYDPDTQSHYFYYYSNELLNKNSAIAIGDVLINESYGTYTPPPFIADSTPPQTSTLTISDSMRDPKITTKVVMAESRALVYEVTYDTALHVLDTTKDIGISFVSEHPNAVDYAYFIKFESGKLVELVEGINPVTSEKELNTLRFKFAPSLMYEHNEEGYHFYFSNVGSAALIPVFDNGKENDPTGYVTCDKLPNPVFYSYGRDYIACPAVFNYDGRLWIDCCAQPQLITNSDLTAMDFTGEDGETLFNPNERSQMMLVAEKADTDTENSMLDEISNFEGVNEVKTSETYDIHLQMCGKYATIPNGSYVKIALGFPEGFNYDSTSEGVTFKIYHRKYDAATSSYIVEEVPCVVTQFGIVAVVKSFSPYMVAAVDAEVTTKSIYASIEGKGGTLNFEDGQIRVLEEGDSYTYTIQPDAGYQIYSVTLNGESVADRVENGNLTLTYDELDANNQLVIEYISDEAAARYQQKVESSNIDGFVDITKHVVPVDQQPVYSKAPIVATGTVTPDASLGGTNIAVIAITVVCVVLAIGAAVTVLVLVVRKKI